MRELPALPRARWARVDDFFARAHASAAANEATPVWRGEIYLELHRATLTTQSGVKRRHRRAEAALIAAETAASLAHLLGAPAPQSLEPHWRVLLKNQFHDILPGSSVREVYQDAEAELDGVIAAGRAEQARALAAIADKLPKGALDDALDRRQSVAVAAAVAADARRRRFRRRRRDDPAARRQGRQPRRAQAAGRACRSTSAGSKTRRCGSRSATTGRSPASSTNPRNARRSPGAATSSGSIRRTSRAPGTRGTSKRITPRAARNGARSIRSPSSKTIRIASRSGSSAAGARRASSRPMRSPPTAAGSTSTPSSTGATGACCCAA